MYKDVMRAIQGVDIFPVVSLLIFFIFFMIVLIATWRFSKHKIDEMSMLPLDGTTNDLTSKTDNHVL